MIAWGGLLASWEFWWARAHRDAWLSRTFLVEGMFVLIFLQWYLSRYTPLFSRKLFFWPMVALILALAAFIMIGGYIRDRLSRARKSGEETPLDG